MSASAQQPVPPVTARAGLVAEAQPTATLLNLFAIFNRISARFSTTPIWD